MSTFYLLNTTTIMVSGEPTKFASGSTINDATDPKTDIETAGGVCWASSDSTVATAAALVQSLQVSKGIDEFASERIMFAAAAKSAKATTSGATGATGTTGSTGATGTTGATGATGAP